VSAVAVVFIPTPLSRLQQLSAQVFAPTLLLQQALTAFPCARAPAFHPFST